MDGIALDNDVLDKMGVDKQDELMVSDLFYLGLQCQWYACDVSCVCYGFFFCC